MITVSREFEWDMGHRVTNHKSLCRNPHGHRYRLVIYVTGSVNTNHDEASQGMVIDFGDLKTLVNEVVVSVYDHSFMYWSQDKIMNVFAEANTELKLIPVSFVPTAECIVAHIAEVIQTVLSKRMAGIRLTRLELNETPKCKAIWEA